MISKDELDKIIIAAKAGGTIISELFEDDLNITQKGSIADVVTQVDVKSEKEILRRLHRDFPTYNFYSEENGENDNGSNRTFVIDPLDGTNNFVLGIPNFTVSIALFEKNEIIAGVIYAPMIDQMFYATKGGGTYFNTKKISVGNSEDITNATVSYMRDYLGSEKFEENVVDKLNDVNVKRVLRNWSPAFDFCLLAKGTMEIIINNEMELHDFAAGKIIVREAGAYIVDFDGNNERNDRNNVFVVANSKSNQDCIVKILN